ncbi:hypothetical protein BJ875DRAFT_263675 [Amylocarpus encephaloides]|uniref:BTB domain-containing protein n=1 Tax=Amylocarpus encephaloides TaxID=45428 RepID=A0A9P8C9R2_9HELO|nr:hypothetical protein BJ875DRAFT_263675 [Amylocarpus encephaloides]
MTSNGTVAEVQPSEIHVDGAAYEVEDIRSTGDLILDVSFENSYACNRSIPTDDLRKIKITKSPIPSPRIFYRVRLDTLKKSSRYFEHLLGPSFAEGASLAKGYADVAKIGLNPTEITADMLPRIKIVDEDMATRTIGREKIFGDILRIIHGAEHTTKPINLNTLTVLVVLADRYNALPSVALYFRKSFINYKYPVALDKKSEEMLRQKILIFYHTEQSLRFTAATKELILRGSSRWNGAEERENDFQTAWWDLPDGLESELAHRRACVVRTIASVQSQYLALYSSKDRQCNLGYDSSGACDSFQLGEMIKFLVKKDLLSLIPFQAASPEDEDYIWPDAYAGDIEALIGLLRQCPSYQINQYHNHCGLRSKILPVLDYIKSCIEVSVGVKYGRSKGVWLPDAWSLKLNKSPASTKPKWITNSSETEPEASDKSRHFDFARIASKGTLGSQDMRLEQAAKTMFTAQTWSWVKEERQSDTALKGNFSTPLIKTGRWT